MDIRAALAPATDNFALNTGINPYKPNVIHSTYNPEWRDKYLSNQWYKNDPVALKARQSLALRQPIPIIGKEANCGMYEEARSYGAAANVVYATYFGGNILIIGAQVDNPTSPSTLKHLAHASQLAHRLTIIAKIHGLTDRQFEVLELADSGLQVAQIAAEMGITEVAVNRLKKRICESLDVTQWNSAVNAYAIEKWGDLVAK